MSVLFVQTNQLFGTNGETFGWPTYPNGISGKQIPCDNTQIINTYWRIPKMLGNRLIGYTELVATDDTKPTPDSAKFIRVKHTGGNSGPTTYDFAVADSDNIGASSPPNQFAYLCDGLGGTLPVMPTVTIPTPILQSGPQSTDSDGANTFIFAFPANPNALLYGIPYPWFNGVAPTTAYVPAAITTTALFATWANSNWGDYGTWSAPTTGTVKLISETTDTIPVTLAGMAVSLTAKHFCLTLNASADAVNGIKISGQVYPFAALSAGRTNRQALIDRISKFFPGATFSISVTNKIDVLTTQLPQNITYNGSNVSGLTWASGACS